MLDLCLEDIFRWLGDPGRYGIIIYFCMGLNYFPVGFSHMVLTFYTATPQHHCKFPTNMTLNETIPKRASSLTGIEKFDRCSMYKVTNRTIDSNRTVMCQDADGWEYQTAGQESSIVAEWDLVCKNNFFASLAVSIYFCGVMIGGLLAGFALSKYGRKPILLLAVHIHFILGLAIFFIHNYKAFVILLFLQGIFIQVLQVTSFILVKETLTSNHQTTLCSLLLVFWALAIMWLSLIAFLIEDWHDIQLVLTLHIIVIVLCNWTIPESLYWLLSSKKYKEAHKVFTLFSRINKVPLPISVMNNLEDIKLNNDSFSLNAVKPYGILDTLRTPEIRKRSIIQFYNWFTYSLVYYGLSFGVPSLEGNKYLNNFISGLVELPAYGSTCIILSKFGRKKTLSSYFFIGGVTCIIAGTISSQTGNGTYIQYLSFAFSLIGKFSISGCFSLLIIYATELFPTIIRNTGLAICSFWSCLGAALAPQIIYLGNDIFHQFPVIIFGTLVTLSGIFTLFLPETYGKSVVNTIDEIENLYKKKKKRKKILSNESEISLKSNFEDETIDRCKTEDSMML